MLDLQVPGRQTFVELKFSKPRIICFLSEAKDILRKKLHKGGCWLIISSEIYGYLIWFLCSFFSFHHEDWCPDFQWRCPWVLASVFAAFGCNVANHSCLLEGHRRAVRKSRMAMLASCVEGTHRGFGDHGGAIEGASDWTHHSTTSSLLPSPRLEQGTLWGWWSRPSLWFQCERGISSCFLQTTSSFVWSFPHLTAYCHLEVKPRAL